MQLLIDEDSKRAITSLWDARTPRLPVLQAGDLLALSIGLADEIRFPTDGRLYRPQALTGSTFRAAVGSGFLLPVAGTFTITDPDSGDTTGDIPFDCTAADIEAAINAIADHTVTVTGQDGFFTITRKAVGDYALFTGAAGGLVPSTLLDFARAVTGDDETRDAQTLRIVQNPAAVATLSTQSAAAGISVAEVQLGDNSPALNHQVRVTLTGDIYKGTWLFSALGEQSGPIGWDASAAQLQRVLEAMATIGGGNVEVTQEEEGVYLLTFIGDLAAQAIAGISVDGTNLAAVEQLTGTLDLSDAAVLMLLNGAESRVVTFEVAKLEDDTAVIVLTRDLLLKRPIADPAASTAMSTADVTDQIAAFSGSGTLLTVSTTGTTDLAPPNPFLQWSQRVVAQAGSGAYTRKLTLDNAEAVEGAIYRVSIELAASSNPTVNIYDDTINGTLLESVTNPVPSAAAYYLFEAEFDGTNWNKIDGHFIT